MKAALLVVYIILAVDRVPFYETVYEINSNFKTGVEEAISIFSCVKQDENF